MDQEPGGNRFAGGRFETASWKCLGTIAKLRRVPSHRAVEVAHHSSGSSSGDNISKRADYAVPEVGTSVGGVG
ncbi:MAG TPA: hypothetical protein VEJ84_14895 [Acidimicrobiales bacterium]|nr:hypothetical protein [Acidimicrobiales bacterium]